MSMQTKQQQSKSRWDEITEIWQMNQWLYGVSGFVLGLIAFPAIQILFNDFGTLLSSLVPEVFGIIFTVIFIDALNRRNDQERETQRLVLQMRNPFNAFAISAARTLWFMNKFQDGSLVGANLANANLSQADLGMCDLRSVYFKNAKMKRTRLYQSDLRGANFEGVDFEGAVFERTGYQPALFDETTVLPDKQTWTSQIDLERFTNRNHPDFWRSLNPDSPAYRINVKSVQ